MRDNSTGDGQHDGQQDGRRPRRRFTSTNRQRLMLGGLAAAGLTLSGCVGEPATEPARFTSVSECTSAGFDLQLCEGGYKDAVNAYGKTAPQFQSLAECEKEWGSSSCAPATAQQVSNPSGTGSVFVPLFAGFVLSQVMQQRYYNTGYYGGGYIGSPIYRGRGGGMVTLDRSGGAGKAVATPVNVNTTTVSRSGFGGMGMSRGSGGGSSFGS